MLRASPDYGLRYGVNTLIVRFGFRARVLVKKLQFWVATGRPLAAAGRGRSIPVERRVRLDGRASMMQPGTRARFGRRARLRYRWRVIGIQPSEGAALSPDDGPGKRDPYWNVPGEIAAANTATPTIEADQRGLYIVRLTVTGPNGRTGTDEVTLRAGRTLGGELTVNPPPIVSVDTMAQQEGKDAIVVGGRSYSPSPNAWLQVLVLDRQNLTVVKEKSFPCDGAVFGNAGHCPTDVADFLRPYQDNALVIVSAPAHTGGPAPYGIAADRALERIGIRHEDFPAEYSNGNNLARGTFSAIGVADGTRGEAVARSASTNAAGGGRMTGYLVRDNLGNYTFAPSERVKFSTQAPGSSATTNVIQVGDHTYPTSLPADTAGGIQAVVVDRDTLAGKQYFWDTRVPNTNTPHCTPYPGCNIYQMRAVLGAASRANDLVFITSLGSPTPSPIQGGPGQLVALNDSLANLADDFGNLGGTRTRLFNSLDPSRGPHQYTLVGTSHSGPGRGIETQAGDVPQSQPVSGTLTRGEDYGFQVADSEATAQLGDPGEKLLDTLFQPPSNWPDQGNAAATAAIQTVGDAAGLGSDPRAQYYTQPYTKEFWDTKIATLKGLSYPTGSDLDTARAELVKEIGWLESEHGYLATLASPFAKNALLSNADLKAIADDIKNKVGVDPNRDARLIAKTLFEGALRASEVIPGIGHVTHVVSAIYEGALEYTKVKSENRQEDADVEFTSRADDVGVELAKRLQGAQDTLTTQFANVIASDYDKLKTVGLCGALDPACPGGADPWQFTTDDVTKAGIALRVAMQVSFYAALIPARYTTWALPDSGYTKANAHFVGRNIAGDHCPFSEEPDSAQIAIPVKPDIPQNRSGGPGAKPPFTTWRVRAIGQLTGAGAIVDPYIMKTPDASIGDRLFRPLDPSGNIDKPGTGLGVYKEGFFDVYLPSDTLRDYPYIDTETRWKDFPSFGFNPVQPGCYPSGS